ncbi:MAG: DUF6125 family protein [Candidatus Syntropharchaeia archaeon]
MELSELPKETLVDIIEMFSKLFLAIDGLWFSEVEKRYGTDVAIEIDTDVWERYGKIEAERIKKTLGIEGKGIQALSKALNFMAWLPAMEYMIETEDNRVVITITDCRPQKARIRDGRGEFACKPVGEALFINFARAIDPRIKMRCVVCPPDEHPEDVWCKWEFTLDG